MESYTKSLEGVFEMTSALLGLDGGKLLQDA